VDSELQPSVPHGPTAEFAPESAEFGPSSGHRPSGGFVDSEVQPSVAHEPTVEFRNSAAVESKAPPDSAEFDPSSVRPASDDFVDSAIEPSIAYGQTANVSQSAEVESQPPPESAGLSPSAAASPSSEFENSVPLGDSLPGLPNSAEFEASGVLIPYPTPSVSIPETATASRSASPFPTVPILPNATVPPVPRSPPPVDRPSSQNAVPLFGMAAAGGGGLLFILIVVAAVCFCRRKPEVSTEGLVEQDGLMTEADGVEIDPTLFTQDAGHQYDNPLAETIIGDQDTAYGE
jgi:hypothetical protein